MKLNFKIVLLKHKLEYYENLKCEKQEINPEKQHYSVQSPLDNPTLEPVCQPTRQAVPASVIFFIMIMFVVIAVTTVVLMVNHDYNTDINIMLHHMQCTVSPRADSRVSFRNCTSRLIDKHNKLKDAF